MTGSYDPLDLAIFNSLGNLAFNVGSGFAEQYEESRNERLGKQAIQRYAEDPSLENFLNLSKFADVGSAIKASQALQQQKAAQDVDTGITQLAQVLGIPPELARVLYENPKMAEFLGPQAEQGPLGHLTDDDLKSYNAHQDDIRTHLDRGALAREMRMSGSKAALVRYAEATGMSPAHIKKMSKKDIQELGRTVEIQELTNAARKQVAMKLMEYKSLTPQERRAAEATILASSKFTEFLASELDATAQTPGIYSPHRIVEKTGAFMDNLFSEHEKNFQQNNGGRQPGRIAMPNSGKDKDGQQGQKVADAQQSTGNQSSPGGTGAPDQPPQGDPNQPQPKNSGPQDSPKQGGSKDKGQAAKGGTGSNIPGGSSPSITGQQQQPEQPQLFPQSGGQSAAQPSEGSSPLDEIERLQKEAKEGQAQPVDFGTESVYPYPGQPASGGVQGPQGQAQAYPQQAQQGPQGQQQVPQGQQLPEGEQQAPMQAPGQEGAAQQEGPAGAEATEHKSVLDLINETLNPEEKQEAAAEEPEKEPLTFKHSFNRFREKARSRDEYKDWSDEELQAAWDNHRKLSQVRKNYKDLEAFPDYQEFRDGVKYGLIEDYFYQGVKPEEAANLAEQTLNLFSDEHLKEVYESTYEHRGRFNDIIKLASEGSKSLNAMPKEVAEKAAATLIDTLMVGGTDMAFAALDQLPLTVTAMAAAAVIPGAGTALSAGIFIGSAIGQVYRYQKQMQDKTYYTAFFEKATTASQENKDYEMRYKFAEEHKDQFTAEERKLLLKGEVKGALEQKVRSLINKKDFVENAMDVMFRPVSALDERYTHIKEKVRRDHPNYNQTAVLAAEMFGSLGGGHLTYKTLGKHFGAPTPPPKNSKLSVITQDGKTIPVKGKASVSSLGTSMKQRLNSTRKQLTNAARAGSGASHVASSAEESFNKYWNAWAKSKGQQAFEAFKQTGNILKESAPARHAAIAGAYAGVDYMLEQTLDEPYYARCLANMGFGSLASVVDFHFYRSKNAARERNIQAEGDMFQNFAKDFGGTANTSPEGRVFDIPAMNKEIVYTPEGTVIVRKSSTPPTNLPEGPVGFKEFNTVQSDNFISYAGISKDLGVPIPDFTRTPESATTTIDTHSVQRYVQDTTNHKKFIIEDSRQKDLAPFVDPETVSKVLGPDVYAGGVPGTNDLKKVADYLYKQVDTFTKGKMPPETMTKLKESITSMAYYFEDHPSLGASFGKGKSLFDDVHTNLFKETTTTKDLVDYHQMINKQKRKIQQTLTKDYSPDNQLLYDFYTGLDTMIMRSLPAEVQAALQKAENAYFAYKFSEKLDGVVKELGTGDFTEWASKGDQFQEKAQYIFDEFQDSHTSNSLRKAMIHEDYFRRYVNKENVEIVSDGRIIKHAHALEDMADLAGAADGLRKATYFTPMGKSVGLATNIARNMKNMNKVGVQKKAEQAMRSSDFAIGADMKPLILASRKGHNLRVVRSPMEKRSAEVPEIVKKIDAYGKVRRKLERKKARELLKKQEEEAAKKAKLEEEKEALQKKLKEQKDINKKNTQDFKKELKKMKIESDERVAIVRADANAKVQVARSKVDVAKTKLQETKVKSGAKVKTAEIGLEKVKTSSGAKVKTAELGLEKVKTSSGARVKVAEAGLEKVKSSSEAKIKTAESRAQKATSDAAVKTEALRLQRDKTGLQREKTGLERERTGLERENVGLQKEATRFTRQELNFQRKQDVAKTKYKDLAKKRRDLIKKAAKTRNVGERNRLVKLIQSVHNRIGNLRPYIDDKFIQGFDLEHQRAQDFLNKF